MISIKYINKPPYPRMAARNWKTLPWKNVDNYDF